MIIFLIIGANVNAQNKKDSIFILQSQKWKFSEVVNVHGSTSDLFVKGKTWAISKIPELVVVEENEGESRHVYQGVFPTDGIYHGEVQFLITIEFKENKYRYFLEQFLHINGTVVNAFDTQPTNTWCKNI